MQDKSSIGRIGERLEEVGLFGWFRQELVPGEKQFPGDWNDIAIKGYLRGAKCFFRKRGKSA
jgi:hypothetical protein